MKMSPFSQALSLVPRLVPLLAFACLSLGAHAAELPGIAFVYLTSPGTAGWTFAHDQAVKRMEEKYGKRVKVTRVENVPESADSERVFRDLAAKGNKLIVGTSFGHQDFALKVAKDYPNITFLNATGYKSSKNFGVYDNRMYQAAYLAGIAAGFTTKTNTLGVVGSIPIPAVVRNINAFTLGARSVNPNVKTKVVWVNSWFDPSKEKQAAETLIGEGADVLLPDTESTATLTTAAEKKVFAIGWNSDMKQFAPTAHLGSIVNHWEGYYMSLAQMVLDGKVKTAPVWLGMAQYGVAFEDLNTEVLKPLALATISSKRSEFQGDVWDVFTGPVKDQAGAIKIPLGKRLSDVELQRINWYVEGVDGALPK
jgi:basic membrane protein A and related proteins